MKKGISVLLIAAALFGFYGGAVSLNDVLACKDYYTGGSSGDSLQQLEDGLNQLKENEQAYLDGQVALAEGEETLAEGEQTLAEGYASYAAAPAQLAAGEKALSSLRKLISGLETAKKHGVSSTKKHDKYWHDAFSTALKPGRAQITEGLQSDLISLIEIIVGGKTYVGTISSRCTSSESYPKFDKDVVATIEDFGTAKNNLESFESDLTSLASEAAICYGAWLQTGKASEPYKRTMAEKAQNFRKNNANVLTALSIVAKKKENTLVTNLLSAIDALADGENYPSTEWEALGASCYSEFAGGFYQTVTANANTISGMVTTYTSPLKTNITLFKKWDSGYQTLAHAKDGKTSKAYPDDLASKKSGVPFAFKSMISNSTLRAAIKQYDPGLLKILKRYSGNKLKNDSMEEFDKDINYLGKSVIPRALYVVRKVKSAGEKTLADGYASYKAAPAQLAAGEQALADGKAQLEAGREQLAAYEDGEQQVRDGLATLVGTDMGGGVTSIVDRIGGDTDFDNGDNHLELDEGLAAVEAGKGYVSDVTAAVTSEIMGRAVGTGALLAAGVLAILAALLSFLKKYKGAGICAILAACAGLFGAFYGNSAGSVFSEAAGSTVGTTAWVAAGILGAVAVVHAIVHFTAKKEAAK